MRIDETHRTWAVASAVIAIVAVVAFIPYTLLYPGGAGGNTWPGLIYGLTGYSMMLYAGLMGARKKVPLWRIGRAQTWMRGHLWMGALTLPMVLLHSNFRARGPLTITLMTLLVIVVLSGITGALVQHAVPRRLTATVQLETIYEQIPEVREQLLREASAIVDKLCAVPDNAALAGVAAVPGAIATIAEEDPADPGLTDEQRVNLRNVYTQSIFPYLRNPDAGHFVLADFVKATGFFEALRRQMPESAHESIADLESICEEERQLKMQRRRYLFLHGWLLVHVPLSITLLVLGGIHALVAIRY